LQSRVDAFNLDFSNYNPFTVSALAQSTLLKVYCTKNSSPTSVALNSGSFPLGAQKRMMSSAGVFLNYNAVLGSTSASSTSSLVPINGGFALNGTVPAQQDVDVGSYLDTLDRHGQLLILAARVCTMRARRPNCPQFSGRLSTSMSWHHRA
jgi:spore coat protein U-like protein